MADKIKKSYKFSKSFYDDAITQGKWWSKLYFKLLWGGVDDNEIARRVLSWIPDDFTGKLLDVPVGTAVFTKDKYRRMTKADITCLDYSQDMLEQAESRFRGAGITNIKTMQGDVGALPFEDGTFDNVLCMNGLHVFPAKEKAYAEILRTLKPGGELLACFYVAGEQKVADWLARTVMTRMGWFTPSFDNTDDVKHRLEPYYDILDLRCNDVFNSDETKAILYGPREMTVFNPTRRTFILNLTWKFNEARSKYRGSGAGEKQKARM